ncbi:MAG: hypothetical protein ACYSX0_09030 [Planctomycetota bacterium]|jgi:hypothetical protein
MRRSLIWAALLCGLAPAQEEVTALRRTELKRLEIQLAAAGGELLNAVRIERVSEIRTFLLHIEEAASRKVLLLGPPAPAIARIVVEPFVGEGLALDVTARAFRLPRSDVEAFVFQSPALLRWLEDRLEVPHYDLREGKEPSLASLLARFRADTKGLTREAQVAPGAGPAELKVLNGDFETALVEEGGRKGSPAGWDRVDGLTTFWVEDPVPGPTGRAQARVIKMDSDVLESEWLKRKREMAKDPDSKPWTKTLVDPKQQHATVGATYGVSFYSTPMQIRKGRAYRLSLDFRACAPKGANRRSGCAATAFWRPTRARSGAGSTTRSTPSGPTIRTGTATRTSFTPPRTLRACSAFG